MSFSFLNTVSNVRVEIGEGSWVATLGVLSQLDPSDPKTVRQIATLADCCESMVSSILTSAEGQTYVTKGVISRLKTSGRPPLWVNGRYGLPFTKDGSFLERIPAPASLTDDDLKTQWDEEIEQQAQLMERVRSKAKGLQNTLRAFASDLHRRLDREQNTRRALELSEQTNGGLVKRIEHLEEGQKLLLSHHTGA